MISTAYVAHYNAPRFLTELKDPSMRNYNLVIAAGFGISFMVTFSPVYIQSMHALYVIAVLWI